MIRRFVGLVVLPVALTAGLVVLGVGAVRSVREELVLTDAWAAVEASRWDEALELTQPLVGPSDAGRRAAELQCWALLAQGERDRCGALVDSVLEDSSGAGSGYAPDPLLARLAIAHRQREGRLDDALELAREAAAAHPDDPSLASLELSAHAALEREDTVLAEFERRLTADPTPKTAQRIALAARYRQRAEWQAALRVLGGAPPGSAVAPGLRGRWFEERVSAQAALGRLADVQVTFVAWRAAGGDVLELEARYALTLSVSQLLDPAADPSELLEHAIATSDRLADPLLRRQLHERAIAHWLVSDQDAKALAVLERAESRGIELQGITREQIERGAALREFAANPEGAPDALLAFAIPPGLSRGTLLVSNHALAEPDAAYQAVAAVAGEVVQLARRPAQWPERWVLRDEAGRVRASGSVWGRPGARSDVRISLAAPLVATGSGSPPRRGSGAGAGPDGRSRVFALVLDCADWRLVQYLRERGELPVLDALFARGHRAVLASDPPLTAAAMESLVWPARGRTSSVVGLLHQLGTEISGLASVGDNPLEFLAPLLPEGESLFEVVGSGSHVAANMLFAHGGISAGRHAEMVGPRGDRRRVKTARARRPLRPAELASFPDLAQNPQASGHLESIAAELDAAVEIAEAGEVDLLALRLESLDILTHALFSEIAGTRQDDGHSNLLAAYRYVDARLGELEAALDEDDVLVVMSDHGIRSAMEHESDAVFVAAGAGVPAGRAPGRPDLRGVAHTLAALVGVETSWPATGVALWLEPRAVEHAKAP